jgi:phage baseplate assembly protein V
MGTIVYTDVTTGEMSIWHCSGSQFTIEPTGPLLRVVSHMDITGNINLKGNITMEGNTTQTGNIDLTGTETVSVDVIANGISLVNHIHRGVRGGTDSTGKPQ